MVPAAFAWARERGWNHLQFVSTAGNSYDADYFGDTSRLSQEMRKAHGVPDGADWEETHYNEDRKRGGKGKDVASRVSSGCRRNVKKKKATIHNSTIREN